MGIISLIYVKEENAVVTPPPSNYPQVYPVMRFISVISVKNQSGLLCWVNLVSSKQLYINRHTLGDTHIPMGALPTVALFHFKASLGFVISCPRCFCLSVKVVMPMLFVRVFVCALDVSACSYCLEESTTFVCKWHHESGCSKKEKVKEERK